VPISLTGPKTLAALGIPIYWVGEQQGVRYELTKTADNRVFIRYLPAGVPIGSSKPYLTIGTYPVSRAFTVTSRLAARSGSVPVDIGKGAVAFSSGKSPESVFLVSGLRGPGRGLRSGARSRSRSGQVAPGHGRPVTRPAKRREALPGHLVAIRATVRTARTRWSRR
jgi:hypothetical protein